MVSTPNNSTAKIKLCPYVEVPREDMKWLSEQLPSVQKLWNACLLAEQENEGQLRQAESGVGEKSFKRALAALEARGLFRFEPLTEVLPSGRLKTVGWKVTALTVKFFIEQE